MTFGAFANMTARHLPICSAAMACSGCGGFCSGAGCDNGGGGATYIRRTPCGRLRRSWALCRQAGPLRSGTDPLLIWEGPGGGGVPEHLSLNEVISHAQHSTHPNSRGRCRVAVFVLFGRLCLRSVRFRRGNRGIEWLRGGKDGPLEQESRTHKTLQA